MLRFTRNFALTLALGFGAAHAEAPLSAVDLQKAFELVQSAIDLQNTNLINWKVGDFHDLKVDFLVKGKARKEATKEDVEANAIWFKTTITLMGQDMVQEALISRATGETLRLVVNGKEQELKNDTEVEVVEQSETRITVPAGTFDCFYVKAKVTTSGKTKEIESWVNPLEVNLDGVLKSKIPSPVGSIKLILERFGSL